MYQYTIKIFLMFFLLMSVSLSATAKKDVIKVYDKGQDGGSRIYTIVCPNGKKTTITQTIDISAVSRERGEVKELNINSDDDSSFKSTAQNLKKKALKLIGQQNRAEICLYPAKSEKLCKSYKDVDTAAKAACDLIR